MKFIAHVCSLIANVDTGKTKHVHRNIEFDVPQEVLEARTNDLNSLSYDELINIAGHFYMNHVDFESTIGPYEWCIWPKSDDTTGIKAYVLYAEQAGVYFAEPYDVSSILNAKLFEKASHCVLAMRAFPGVWTIKEITINY